MTKNFDPAQWEKLLFQSITQIQSLSKLKGGEYAGDQDRLANFRRNATALGLPMETIWAVYAGKHWDAIQQFIKDNQQGKSRIRLEPIEGRVDDLLVYLLLFKAMLWEDRRDLYTGKAGDNLADPLAGTFDETRGQIASNVLQEALQSMPSASCPICRGPMTRGILHHCISGPSHA